MKESAYTYRHTTLRVLKIASVRLIGLTNEAIAVGTEPSLVYASVPSGLPWSAGAQIETLVQRSGCVLAKRCMHRANSPSAFGQSTKCQCICEAPNYVNLGFPPF